MRVLKSFFTLLMVAISCSAYSRTGYRIAVDAGESGGKAYLQLLQWDRKVDIDSVMADKEGVFLFKGKTLIHLAEKGPVRGSS